MEISIKDINIKKGDIIVISTKDALTDDELNAIRYAINSMIAFAGIKPRDVNIMILEKVWYCGVWRQNLRASGYDEAEILEKLN